MDVLRLARKFAKSLTLWNVRRAWYLLRKQGPVAVWERVCCAFRSKDNNRIRELEALPRELASQRKTPLPHQPKISLAVATFNTPLPFLKEVVASVFAQTYSNWELCVADGGSTRDGVTSYLQELAAGHPDKVKLTLLPENLGIAGNQNEALKLCGGEYVGLVDHDDIVLPNALYEFAKRLNEDPSIEVLYSDESITDSTGTLRTGTHLKPDFAPDTLRGLNYVCHLTLIRKDLLDALGGLRLGFDGAQDYDLILRATEKAHKVVHVPRVLYLWRAHEHSTAQTLDAKPYALEAGRRAIADHIARVGLPGRVEIGQGASCQIEYELKGRPKVSIVIPNKDQRVLLRNCIASILNESTYDNVEIVIVENNSCEVGTFRAYRKLTADPRVRVVRYVGDFNFSRLVNFGARHATGEYLILLNNDTEAIAPNWIEKMLEFGQRDDVGVVGANLLYADDRSQHAGIIVGIQGIAGHVHRSAHADQTGYMGKLCTAQNLSAVTGACLMVRMSLFDRLGGFDPEFAIALNDVDFCLRVREFGKLVVWTPHARLYHFESASRGYEDTPQKVARLDKEVALLHARWRHFLKKGDPYYNPNLSLLAEDFRIATPFDGLEMRYPIED